MPKIVFSDVDGTLLNSELKISPRTEEAVKTLQSRGIPFVIISARSPSGIYPITEEYGLCCPIISYSGALILDEDRRVLFHRGLSKDRAREIIDYIEEGRFGVSWCIYSLDEWIVKDKTDPRIVKEEWIVNAQARQGTVASASDDIISKILCIGEPDEILKLEKILKKAFPQYSIVKSFDSLLEIMESGITKETAVRTLCKLWDIPVAEAVAFGDNYNDEEMLTAVGYGFLMGNAPEPLKKKIKMHTKDNDHDGIYSALAKLKLI